MWSGQWIVMDRGLSAARSSQYAACKSTSRFPKFNSRASRKMDEACTTLLHRQQICEMRRTFHGSSGSYRCCALRISRMTSFGKRLMGARSLFRGAAVAGRSTQCIFQVTGPRASLVRTIRVKIRLIVNTSSFRSWPQAVRALSPEDTTRDSD
ncbi:hypothetical protein BOTBODRAFT_221791 [Botryobasidium botryosum FD-172 SS1]|uniref:Uncharacterized protein n=1 Tax=Botryobasidium botryosum (strain FD-172 SS1) TaxID=930990 RepID=A0A067MQJ0_BOTB1|nr:hypothetical protein BOTBODRAFT_221791 [Botryobasidium botryosum FD-172 SS1]